MNPQGKNLISGLTALILVLSFPLAGVAAELYKYTNEDGVTVLDSHVPPRYVRNGYTILSADGRVLEVIPRALTASELAERDRQRLAEEQAEQEIEAREAADAALLRLYGSAADVERARDTKLASVEGFINTARGNLVRLFDQKRQLEAAVANIERMGGEIPQENLDRIDIVTARIAQTEQEIEAKSRELDQLMAQYAADLKRVVELRRSPAVSSQSQF